MTTVKEYHGQDLDEQLLSVCLQIVPRADLPIKKWSVDLGEFQTIKQLRDAIFDEYMVPSDVFKLCTANNSADLGMKDFVRVEDLPAYSDEQDGAVKRAYLLPRKGKEDELLELVLEWAFQDGCIDDYEACGCCYSPKTDEGTGLVGGGGRGPSLMQRMGSSIGSWKGYGKRRSGQPMGSIRQEGDKVTMDDPIPPFPDRIPFNSVCCCIAIANMVVVALEADYTCWGSPHLACLPADRMQWYILDILFTFLFIGEVAIRMACEGVTLYVLGDPILHPLGIHGIHCLDLAIIFFRFLDIFFEQAGIDTKIKIISCFRVCQIARVAKSMQLIPGVKQLWLIVKGFMDLLKTVLWVMLLLVIIFWVGGICMTIIVGQQETFFDYKASQWEKGAYFNTVPKSVYSLFQIMTLSNWSSAIVRPVQEMIPAMFLFFVPFLMLTTVGLLNIIVGVVVESTLNTAQLNAAKQLKETHKMHSKVMDSLKMVFEEADTDGGGTLDRDELHKSMKKPHVRDRMKLLDIPIKDLDELFTVLDEAGTGEIRTDMFFRGCSRLRGPAMSSDLHRMSVDFSRYITWTDDLIASSKANNQKLSALLHDMESVDRDIIKSDVDEYDPVLGCRRERSVLRDKAWVAEHGEWEKRELRGNTKETAKKSEGSQRSSRKPSLLAKTLTTSFEGFD